MLPESLGTILLRGVDEVILIPRRGVESLRLVQILWSHDFTHIGTTQLDISFCVRVEEFLVELLPGQGWVFFLQVFVCVMYEYLVLTKPFPVCVRGGLNGLAELVGWHAGD